MHYLYEQTDELLDLVNRQDIVIGTIERSKAYATGLHNFRAIGGLLINQHGHLWIPRRTADKQVSPLHLGFSVGGHVASGETYDQAFERELQEELNINPKNVHYKKIGLLTPHEHQTGTFVTVYLIFTNKAPHYNPADFINGSWVTPQHILHKISCGEKVQNDLQQALHHFFTHTQTPRTPQKAVDHCVKPGTLTKEKQRWQRLNTKNSRQSWPQVPLTH